MIKKLLYESPEINIMALRNGTQLCTLSNQGGNEGYTEDETGNDYDE
ncbi:MAG: hypothetical protein KBS89_03570 [Bacteroidales bacterium]|nr:hypothetical protein [Candidatus Egerieousia equi]